jgi:hypothetical protein
MTFCMGIDQKRAYKFCMKILLLCSQFRSTATVRKFEVIPKRNWRSHN